MYRPLLATVLAIALAGQADAADRIRLGFVSALSGAAGIGGQEEKRGLDLALQRLGNKLGGVPVTVFAEDDKGDPNVAVQLVSKFIDEDKVDIVTGFQGSNTAIPAVPMLLEAGIWVVGSLAGPQEFAGKDCRQNAFWTEIENEDWDDALAMYLNQSGVKSVYFMGADYQAGWEKIGGAMRYFKGKSYGPVYTPWQTQVDLAPEMSQIRAANPEAVLVFYPGASGISFVKQFAQAGLGDKIKLYAEASLTNELNFAAQGDAAVGIVESTNWSYDLDNPANKEFVASYEKAYGKRPTFFTASQYDAINLLDAAVAAVHGKIEDKDAFRSALRHVQFPSIRGPFKFDTNQYPIQNIYLTEVVKDPDGTLRLALKGTAVENWRNPYHDQCPMKW
jgi:branched-chain amino acid transport system substrate-binding protein